MSAWAPEGEDEESDGDDSEEDVPDEVEVSRPGDAAADDDGFDDLPETHLSDEAYEQFVVDELDSRGRPKGDPPVGWILLGLTAGILVVWALFFA